MSSSLSSCLDLVVRLLPCMVVGCGAAQSGSHGPVQPSPPPIAQMTAGEGAAKGNNMLWNSTFEEGTLQPWGATVTSPAKGNASVTGEEACFAVEGGGANAYDVILRQRQIGIWRGHKYQVRMKVHSTEPTKIRPKVSQAGPPYTEYWSAVIEAKSTPQSFTGEFEGKVDDENAELVIHMGGDLTGKTPFTVCLDNIELNDPEFKVPEERKSVAALPKVRVNQLGYLPAWPKIATVKSTSQQPIEWQLVDAGGKTVASGKTKPFGEDKAAGEVVHNADFSSFATPGKGYKLRVGKDESFPFDIAPELYNKLKYDALAFFYHQRSGVEIKLPYAGEQQYTRPAAHLSDKSVPCAPEAKCSHLLDVTGGWYDAGDHGKYVVNAGISLWTMQNQYETLKYLGKTAEDFADGKMNIPENKNGKPDILDEARFEMEWMLRMQIPSGPQAGMAHHSVHDEKWTAIPTKPHEDAMKRYLRPATTAATLNLAGAAAQTARLWKTLDPAFSKKCLDAAEKAYQAAKKNPNVIAEGMKEGGGAYGDSLFEDEFYWAEAELFITTGKPEYKAAFEKRAHHKVIPTAAGGGTASMSWDHLAALGKISLAVVPNGLSKAEVDEQRKQIIGAADRYLANIQKRGYRVPLESEAAYPWGSNSFIVNDTVIMGLAYYFTKDKKYAGGVVDSMDYVLGRNPKVQSYVTGYGTRPLKNPHHRFWAHQKDNSTPPAPPGIVSGGPNSSLQDPYAKQIGLPGCPPQQCFVDHIESWSTNEIAINWNAPLAWGVAFLDELGQGK